MTTPCAICAGVVTGCPNCTGKLLVQWTDGILYVLEGQNRAFAIAQGHGTGGELAPTAVMSRLAVGLLRQGKELSRVRAVIGEVEEVLGLGELFADPEHAVHFHAESLPDAYRALAQALTRIQASVATLQPIFDDDRAAPPKEAPR